MSDFNNFSKDLDKAFQKKVVNNATQFIQRLVLDLYTTITANSAKVGFSSGSPVLTGQYYTNHNIAINKISEEKTGKKGSEESPLPGLSLSRAQLTLRNFKLGDTVFISNALPYARRIEDGWSTMKAPQGVYRVAAELIKVKYKNVTLL